MAENNKKDAEKRNIDAKNQIAETNIKMSNEKMYATGAGAFADFFNGLVDEVKVKAQKEEDKPRYRFLDKNQMGYFDLIGNSTLLNEIADKSDKLYKKRYVVEVIENMDIKNVSEGGRYYIRISNLNGVYVDIDMIDYQEKIKEFQFNEQDYIENEIAKIVGSTNNETKEVAILAVDYLAHIMYFRSLYTLTYKRIGWDFYSWDRNRWIFKYDKVYAGNVLFFNGRLSKSLVEGLEEAEDASGLNEYEWVLHTKMLMSKHPYCALILGAGISGLVRQLLPYTKENNININIVGKPASGKSTICHYLLSVFGNPAKLEGSFTDTENKMEENRVKRPVLPYVLDERMLKIETDTEKHKQQTVLMDIFREYEGKVKERLGKQYEEESGERTYGPIISSSVRSMMEYVLKSENDLGQYRRFIEFNIGAAGNKILFDSSEEAKLTESIAYGNYGYGIRLIVDYMLELLNMEITETDEDGIPIGGSYINSEPTILRLRFEKLDKEINQRLEDREEEEKEKCKKIGKECRVVGLTSSSKRFALIVLSYQILREALLKYEESTLSNLHDESRENEENDAIVQKFFELREKYINIYKANVDDGVDMSESIIQLLADNLVDKMNRIRRNPAEKMNEQYNYFINNREHFVEVIKFDKKDLENLVNSKGNKLGCCIIDESERSVKLYTVYDYALPQFWEMVEIPEPEIIKKYIGEVVERNIKGADAVKYGMENYDTVRVNVSEHSNNKDISTGKQKFHELEFIYTDLKEGES